MKRMVCFALAIITMMTLLAACGTDPLVGIWTTTIEDAEGQMILRRDGTGDVTSNDITRPCTWTVEDGTLTVVQEISGIPYTFLNEVTYTVKGRTLTVTSKSGNTLVFKKK